MRSSIAIGVPAFAAAAAAASPLAHWAPHWNPWGYLGKTAGENNWNLKKFTSLVAFGDSYTDDSRLGYFISHNGSAPPVGYDNPAVCVCTWRHLTVTLTDLIARTTMLLTVVARGRSMWHSTRVLTSTTTPSLVLYATTT